MTQIQPNINIQYGQNVTIVTFTQEKILEQTDIKTLQDSILSIVEQAGPINLILDFSNVQFLSSSVLGLLIRISKRVYEAGGQLALCSIIPKIFEIFKITRLTNIFDIYDDIETATEALSPS
ncbi:MAG: STAS domain-containing protein [Planctomycetota bacterium]|jgi:anti-sigma B factor antagonist